MLAGALLGALLAWLLPTWLVVIVSAAGLLWLIKTMEAR
jgi:hypothetical protein